MTTIRYCEDKGNRSACPPISSPLGVALMRRAQLALVVGVILALLADGACGKQPGSQPQGGVPLRGSRPRPTSSFRGARQETLWIFDADFTTAKKVVLLK